MPSPTFNGTCALCGRRVDKRRSPAHQGLWAPAHDVEAGTEVALLMKLTPVPPSRGSTRVFADTWSECHGHLTMFAVPALRYSSSPSEPTRLVVRTKSAAWHPTSDRVRRHRPAHEKALALLAIEPGIGTRALNETRAGVRRVHLARTRYDLHTGWSKRHPNASRFFRCSTQAAALHHQCDTAKCSGGHNCGPGLLQT